VATESDVEVNWPSPTPPTFRGVLLGIVMLTLSLWTGLLDLGQVCSETTRLFEKVLSICASVGQGLIARTGIR